MSEKDILEGNKQGKCIIFSAPSGAGKTTIVQYLLNQNLGLEFSISACSRYPRRNEIDGKDYRFFSIDEFNNKIQNNEFIEWEEVYKDNFYGTLKSEIQRIWGNNHAVIFDVDVIGGLNLKKQFKDQALAVFVQAPSIEELEKRLRFRSTESEEKILVRMGKARQELEKASEFDIILVNADLEKACQDALILVRNFLAK
ncbi:MAG: guanylate kinase [Bacteroidota bacterium]